MKKIQKNLISMADINYRIFYSKLIPNISIDQVLGIRIPKLRLYAKQLIKCGQSQFFLNQLPHFYYEENNLHALLISEIKDFNTCLNEVERFLPYVDNWATCDSIRPRAFSKNKSTLFKCIERWICSEHEYTIRFGIEMLMVHYLDEDFNEKYMQMVSGIKSEYYYVKMMIAWYFATAFYKQPEKAMFYLLENKLENDVHNKTIQKAVESYRVSEDIKSILKTMRS